MKKDDPYWYVRRTRYGFSWVEYLAAGFYGGVAAAIVVAIFLILCKFFITVLESFK